MTTMIVTTMPVRDSAISAFASVLGEPRDTVPPTFAIVPVLRAVRELLGPAYSGTVHRGQELTHHRPIRAGDVLDARARLRDRRTVGGMVVSRVDTEVRDGAGRPVCTALTTLVAPGTSTGRPTTAPVADEPEWGPFAVPVRHTDLASYAAAADDPNPIHLDTAAAAEAGLPGVVAHGMLTVGLALRVLATVLGGPVPVTAWTATFRAPVIVGPGHAVPLRVSGRAFPSRHELRVTVAGQLAVVVGAETGSVKPTPEVR
ncbi:MaoC/PaaZ C-terminal domain-containing protein [Actinophytocola sediminis]